MGCCMSAARVNEDSHSISMRHEPKTHSQYEPGPGKVRLTQHTFRLPVLAVLARWGGSISPSEGRGERGRADACFAAFVAV